MPKHRHSRYTTNVDCTENKLGENTFTIVNKHGRRVQKLAALASATNRKQLPLCSKHHIEFENGIFSDLNATFLKSIFTTLKYLTTNIYAKLLVLLNQQLSPITTVKFKNTI